MIFVAKVHNNVVGVIHGYIREDKTTKQRIENIKHLILLRHAIQDDQC